MKDPLVEQIERTIAAASNAIAEQHRRIGRQRARIEKLDRQGCHEMAEHARGVLKLMEDFLERQRRELRDAERRREARLAE
jgi:hypothetical protein